MKTLPAILLLLLHCLLAAAPLQAQTSSTNRVRGSELPSTNSIAWSNTFLAVVFPYPHPYHTNGTMQISASNLLESLKLFPNWPSSTGEVTTVQLRDASNAVYTAQAARAPTNNAVIHSSSISSVPLTLFGQAGQDGNMLNVKDSSGNILFSIGYDGQISGAGANSARLASTSTAGHVWTAIDTTGIGAFGAPAQQTNSSLVRQLELTAASNAAVAFSMTLSNTLYGTETTRNAAVSNAAVAFAMAVSNAVYSGETARNAEVSNAAIAFTLQASNTLYSLIGSGSGGTNNPVTLSAGTLTIITSQSAHYYTNASGSFPFAFSGTLNASARASLTVSNTTSSPIYITNNAGIYDPRDAAFVTTLAIPAQAQSTFHFRRNATSGWELEGVIEKPLGFEAGVNTTLRTNAGNVSVVGAFSFSTNGSSWISATQLVARSGIVISNDTTGTVSFHVQASGSGGPTTNAPPQTLAINSGTGSTNVVIDMRALGATNYVRFTLTANAGIVVTNVVDGKEITVEVVQDSTGNRTMAQSSVGGAPLRFGADITGFALSTNGTYIDKLRLHGSGTNAQVVGNLRGYAP